MASSAASSSSAIANDGPVLTIVNKRIRSLRKKLNRILKMEESVAEGRLLNKEQAQALCSKQSVVAKIDELERLIQPLSEAINEEVQLNLEKNKRISHEGETECKTNESSFPIDLLCLVYFGNLFNVKSLKKEKDALLMRSCERSFCLIYDYVNDEISGENIFQDGDMDLIAKMGNLMISRPENSRLSHKHALEKCVEHAKLWLANSEQPIEPHSTVTYARLREKLNKIMASDFFTVCPQINDPIEMAQAFRNYNFCRCPLHESMTIPIGFSLSLEGSSEEGEEKVWRRRWF